MNILATKDKTQECTPTQKVSRPSSYRTGLESQMRDVKDMTSKMNSNMGTLMGMFKEFMRASATTS
jgi:hypothetical protein